jgi:hypothetical protein
MEHWPDLNLSLTLLYNILDVNSTGLIEVPNFDFILRKAMFSEFITDHIFYFDENTLRNVLEVNGFNVLCINNIWHDYILSAEVMKRKIHNTSFFEFNKNQVVEELNQFIVKFNKNVVIWGAGHQSLSLISIGKLFDKVSHIVDSADFKQNKFCPTSKLFIKSPQSLLVDRPQAVIIMAAAYSDEVYQLLVNKYPEIKNIAVVRENKLEILREEY